MILPGVAHQVLRIQLRFLDQERDEAAGRRGTRLGDERPDRRPDGIGKDILEKGESFEGAAQRPQVGRSSHSGSGGSIRKAGTPRYCRRSTAPKASTIRMVE